MLDVLILRDPRESAAKCSLTPLRGLATDEFRVRFVDYHPERRLDAEDRVLLHTGGEGLSAGDRDRGLLLIDCSWRRVEKLSRTVDGTLRPRRLEGWSTAYPRRSKTFPDPSEGLASVEALFAASAVLGRALPELLAAYPWRDAFLERNRSLIP